MLNALSYIYAEDAIMRALSHRYSVSHVHSHLFALFNILGIFTLVYETYIASLISTCLACLTYLAYQV